MKYLISYLPADLDNQGNNKIGPFDDRESAWAYFAEKVLCDECKKMLADGYYEESDGERVEISHPSQTWCADEWFVRPVEIDDQNLVDPKDVV